jgi:hypothetical protein
MSEQSASISLAPEESLKLAQVASIDNFDQPSSAGHFPTVSAGEDNIQEVAAQCFLRMEDDDDSSHDLLATMDAELAFGNIYCGHKQVRPGMRYLILDTPYPVLTFDMNQLLDQAVLAYK